MNWFDAARFANWMANGQPTDLSKPAASTENGAYDLLSAASGIASLKNVSNPNTGGAPAFYLRTQGEWYKAAYFRLSDSAPGNVGSGGANQANIYRGVLQFHAIERLFEHPELPHGCRRVLR